jgi:LysM repeat protein
VAIKNGLALELAGRDSYVRRMKQICIFLAASALCAATGLKAQDAATEERLNKLSGQIEDLMASQKAQHKQIEALGKEIEAAREQAGKPNTAYAGQEDLKRLAEAIKEVDRKRIEDSERIGKELKELAKLLKAAPTPTTGRRERPGTTTPTENTGAEKPPKDEKGFPYVIQSGDTLSAIVQAYREKNIKVSTDQILKANPELKAERLKPGQKIWIPAPQS